MSALAEEIKQAVREAIREELPRLREELARGQAQTDPTESLGLTECARISGYSVDTLRRWIKSGKIAAAKGAKEWRVKRADLDSMLEKSVGPDSVIDLDARIAKMRANGRGGR